MKKKEEHTSYDVIARIWVIPLKYQIRLKFYFLCFDLIDILI